MRWAARQPGSIVLLDAFAAPFFPYAFVSFHETAVCFAWERPSLRR
jgi:hypothetical protein